MSFFNTIIADLEVHSGIICTFVVKLKLSQMILGVFGPWQVVAIIVLALLLFGGKKIPELMKGLGKGVKEFKDASNTNSTESESSEESK